MGGGWGIRQEAVHLIHFGTYNIKNGRNEGLESALRGVSQSNIGLRVFQETKVTEGIYMWEYSRYMVVESEAPSTHSRGIAMFYCAE